MKKLRCIFIFIIILLMSISLTACGNNPKKDYKTEKPSSIGYNNNIFYFNSQEELGYNTYFAAKKVFLYDDFSADIIYEITGKTLARDGEEEQLENAVSKENIIKAIDSFNKKIYANDIKLYDKGNRVLYLDEESIKDEIINGVGNTETTNIVLEVYVTNIGYACSSYKLISVEDYIKAEDEKTSIPGQQNYHHFKDKNGKPVSLYNMENTEKYKVFLLERYSPPRTTEFIFEGKITAYYNNDASIDNSNPKSISITSNNDLTIITVMYQPVQNSINWAILGPAIGITGVFLILLTLKIVQSKRRTNAKKR